MLVGVMFAGGAATDGGCDCPSVMVCVMLQNTTMVNAGKISKRNGIGEGVYCRCANNIDVAVEDARHMKD